jgi:simple sugar transport system permease protein
MTFYEIIITLLVSAIKSGTIVIFATVGEIYTERSGILNLGVEGMMLLGAFAGYATAVMTHNIFLAFLIAGLVGSLVALIHAFITITLRANQVVSGLALTMFGGGVSSFLGKGFVKMPLPESVKLWTLPIKIPLLGDIPVIGQVLFNHNIFVYISYFIPIIAWFVLSKTKWGLAIRSTGEEPLASEIMGIKVIRVRYLSTLLGGLLCGISGAYLSIVYSSLWGDGMTAGRGWITIALVIFSNWRPMYVFLGAYLFGGMEAIIPRLQAFGVELSPQLLKSVPYIFTILFLLIIQLRGTRSNMPKNLGNAYFREGRD